MKRTIVICLIASLVTAIAAAPASGVGPRGMKDATLYFHGNAPVGEPESVAGILDNTFLPMDPTEPTDPVPKSMSFGWGNQRCAGNRFFPVWVGKASGTITGDVKVIFTSASVPQDVEIRIWADVNQLLCSQDYVEPDISETVTLPAGVGNVEVEVPNDRLRVRGTLMVQISPVSLGVDTPGPGRILYDSSTAPSRIEFACVSTKRGCV